MAATREPVPSYCLALAECDAEDLPPLAYDGDSQATLDAISGPLAAPGGTPTAGPRLAERWPRFVAERVPAHRFVMPG